MIGNSEVGTGSISTDRDDVSERLLFFAVEGAFLKDLEVFAPSDQRHAARYSWQASSLAN